MQVVIGPTVEVTPGDIRALGVGDSIIVRRDEMTGDLWGYCWPAIGVAVARGADVSVR